MGRKVKPRLSFHSDMRYFLRFLESVEMDSRMEVEDKRSVIRSIRAVNAVLIKYQGSEVQHMTGRMIGVDE
jgi:hypothetical protein